MGIGMIPGGHIVHMLSRVAVTLGVKDNRRADRATETEGSSQASGTPADNQTIKERSSHGMGREEDNTEIDGV